MLVPFNAAFRRQYNWGIDFDDDFLRRLRRQQFSPVRAAATYQPVPGGNDTASGFGGHDVFNMGAALTANDTLDAARAMTSST